MPDQPEKLGPGLGLTEEPDSVAEGAQNMSGQRVGELRQVDREVITLHRESIETPIRRGDRRYTRR